MKYKITNIYDDNHTIISDNPLLLADDRLADLMERANDLDIIIEADFGERELLTSMLKEDSAEVYIYNLNKIYKSVYAVFLANLTKYNTILEVLEQLEAYEPTNEYGEEKVFGERVKENEHGAQSTTNTYGTLNKSLVHGAQSTTNTYGNINKTVNTGASTDSTTNGARENTQSVNPSFGNAFSNTGKDSATASTDSTTYGARSDSEQTTRGTDTIAHATYTDQDTTTRGQDTTARATYKDTETQPETIDTITGYKNLLKNISDKYGIVNRIDLIKLIANDVVNQISYAIYL